MKNSTHPNGNQNSFPKQCYANNHWQADVFARLSSCLATSEPLWLYGVGIESSRERERTGFQFSSGRFLPSSVVNSKSSIRICWANVVVVLDNDNNNSNQRAAAVVRVINRLSIPIAGSNNSILVLLSGSFCDCGGGGRDLENMCAVQASMCVCEPQKLLLPPESCYQVGHYYTELWMTSISTVLY
jgi:hypothetical protein